MHRSLKFVSLLALVALLGTGCLTNNTTTQEKTWPQPLERAAERDRKLTFGLFVTPDPDENPIDPPERFTGYHTALDFEIFEEEIDQEVMVYAICDGQVVYKDNVNGYGGTFVQRCEWQNQTVTVLYGHLDLDSIVADEGDEIVAGEPIGSLGDHKSAETSLTRKHLHLGIHKGPKVELRGYVETESELEDYLNPAVILGYE